MDTILCLIAILAVGALAFCVWIYTRFVAHSQALMHLGEEGRLRSPYEK